jgi:hypothetical protein
MGFKRCGQYSLKKAHSRCRPYYNHATGGCISKETLKRLRCNTRVNPASGRCVLKAGRVGSRLSGRAISCASLLNVKSARCVTPSFSKLKSKTRKSKLKTKARKSKLKLKKTKTRKLTKRRDNMKSKKRDKIVTLGEIPRQFDGLVSNCEAEMQWRRQMHIGSGANGSVYRMCRVSETRKKSRRKAKMCDYVVKIQPYNREAKAELKAYIKLKGTGLTPKMHAAWRCKGNLYIVMEKMRKCAKKKVEHDLPGVLRRLEKKGWLHVDTHSNNVMCNEKGKVVLIDFGWAVERQSQGYKYNHPLGRVGFEYLRRAQNENVTGWLTSKSF